MAQEKNNTTSESKKGMATKAGDPDPGSYYSSDRYYKGGKIKKKNYSKGGSVRSANY